MSTATNLDRFYDALREQYKVLFETDRDYAYAAARMTPAGLALKITLGLAAGTADKSGKGVKNVCEQLGVPCTYKAIRAFFDLDDVKRRNEQETALRLRFQREAAQ